MSLYYNTDNYELSEIDDNLVEEWKLHNNPKYFYYIPAPSKPSENAVWNKGFWSIPSPIIPQTISARQVRIWLIQNGIQLSAVESAIETMEDPTLKEITKVEWEYAPYIERNHPMLTPLAQVLGLTQQQLDQAFIDASQI